MKTLIVGAGVIGVIYGWALALIVAAVVLVPTLWFG